MRPGANEDDGNESDRRGSGSGDSTSAADSALGAALGALVVAPSASYPVSTAPTAISFAAGQVSVLFAIFALSIDLIWGFAGILSLGQAVYFGIGAYFVALSLKINYAIEHPTRYGGKHSRLHGMERPHRTAGLHDAADQHCRSPSSARSPSRRCSPSFSA